MQQPPIQSDRYYVHATSSPADDRTRVLKQGETFAVFNRYGDIRVVDGGEQGVYHEGTRFLSQFTMQTCGAPPILLSSTIRKDNVLLIVDLTNVEVLRDGEVVIPQDTVHISRTGFLWQGVCYTRLQLKNYGDGSVALPLEFSYGADFVDIFEVRGLQRDRRGTRQPARIEDQTIRIHYDGLDRIRRTTVIRYDPSPTQVTESGFEFVVNLAVGEERTIEIAVGCEVSADAVFLPHDEAMERASEAMARICRRMSSVATSNDEFNSWLDRSATDIAMMVTETPEGPYPYAGVPWYSTAFGRDGIITALEMLWVDPAMARGVLQCLAAYQATTVDPETDAEPGKVFHETRRGEMANLHEHPFQLYYGSIDVTPLFIMLAGEYFQHTGDLETVRALEPNIHAALHWMDTYGDLDGDGFLEYARATDRGLINQGWKDSHDSVFHADGSMAQGPIALCEVQGYAYAAKLAAVRIKRELGDDERASELEQQAETLAARFDDAFWDEELGTYVLALDGNKQPCRVPSSNAGHCLYTGIARPERAGRVAASLMEPEMFSGWGVRTVPEGISRFNPMSYHNGSVWPHDNALIAAGLARYGYKELALNILTGMLGVGLSMDLQRLPELFCGFTRMPGAEPVHYPVACLPQSWSAATVFMVLGACLGMEFSASKREIIIRYPVLPDYLDVVEISNLSIGDAVVDIRFLRYPDDVGVRVLSRPDDVDVIVLK